MRGLLGALLLSASVVAAARADVFRLLDDPHEAVQARVDLIQGAQRQVEVVYFIARNDRVALTILALLREAQHRGVATRLVVDATFQHIPKPVLAALAADGVRIRVYHPLTLRHPSWTWRRMHEKVIVADSDRYITGGRNLAEGYFGMAKKNFVDRDVYVDGFSASDAQQHFEELWGSRDVRRLHVTVTDAERERAARQLDELTAALRHGGGFVALDTGADLSEGHSDSGAVQFIADPLRRRGGPRVGERLEALFADARNSIVIESPYVVPPASMLALLEKKCGEGVSIAILTNSLHSTDGLLPYVAYLRYRRRLLRAGVTIREFDGPDTLHAKSIVIDGRFAIVGSYNLDPRSQNLNAEIMCVADDPELARELQRSIDAHAANATEVLRHTKLGRTVRTWTARVLARFLEPQL